MEESKITIIIVAKKEKSNITKKKTSN